jgi:V8-like Glu-specific endopeptidase
MEDKLDVSEAPLKSYAAWETELLDDELDYESNSYEFEATVRDTPTPGSFYRIQYGQGGLIKTAARAYQVPLQPNPIRLAKLINDHPYNRRFWRSPNNTFERQYFPEGIITFNPSFIESFAAQKAVGYDAKAPRGHNFAVLWIPSRFQLAHPMLAPGGSWPSGVGISEPQLVRALASNVFCSPDLARADCPGAPITKTNIDAKAKPFRWICHITAIFVDPLKSVNNVVSGSGFLIRKNLIASCAHLLYDNFEIKDQTTGNCVGILRGSPDIVIVSPGKINADEPFGSFVVDVNSSGNKQNLIVHPSWIKKIDSLEMKKTNLCQKNLTLESGSERNFDIALLSLKGARTFGNASFTGGHFGSTFQDSKGDTVVSGISEPAKHLQVGGSVSIGGYPGDLKCEQSESPGTIELLGKFLIAARASISHGNSGGPVWMEEEIMVDNIKGKKLRLVGIATEGNHPDFCTLAVRLSGHKNFIEQAIKTVG